jgi:hypothetical protein
MTTTQIGMPVGKPLPFNDNRHLQAHQFLVDEAYLSMRSSTRHGWTPLPTTFVT